MRQALIRELLAEAMKHGRRPIIQGIIDDLIMEVYVTMPSPSKVARLLGTTNVRVGQARSRVESSGAAS